MSKSRIYGKTFLQETVRLSLRGCKIWQKENPKLLLSTAMAAVVKSLTPYVDIFLLAKLIDEIAGTQNRDSLLELVLAVIMFNAVLAMLGAVLERWKNIQWAEIWHVENKIFMTKLLSMDYATISHAHTQDLRAQIWQNNNSGAWGLYKLLFCFRDMVSAALSIVAGTILTMPLFALQVPQSGGNLVVLNNPLFMVLIILVMFAVTFLSPYFSVKADQYWVKFSEEHKMGNRLFSFWLGTLGSDRSRALDVRMYRQDILCKSNLEQNNPFSAKSKLAKAANGPMGCFSAIAGSISQVFMGMVYAFVCLKSLGGAFGIGLVTQYIGSITALAGGVSLLLSTFGTLSTNVPFLRTVFEFLDMPNDMYQGNLHICDKIGPEYKIEFCDVSFMYPGQKEYALRNVSMTFHTVKSLAIVGMNGSGKTTFIKLLCRLYDPTEGRILLNGIDIRTYDYRQYLAILSVVFQDFGLLSFELGQNIAARISYDNDKAGRCLDKAGFGKRLGELPKGLSTVLYKDFDENGVNVSRGEAQKIALARALYKDSAILMILDEPTAALDPVAEFELYSRMNEIVDNLTAIFISHRLSSCRFCQNIVVFHEGKIVQYGSHDELVADESGKYYELWNAQAQYYISSENRE